MINTYAACQSAEVAHTFDPSVGSPNKIQNEIPDRYRFNPSSPRFLYQSNSGDNYHKGGASRANHKFINFANLGDVALGAWDINQKLKPDVGWQSADSAYAYAAESVSGDPLIGSETTGSDFYFRDSYTEYLPDTPTVPQHLNWPDARYKIFAHVTPAASRATGAVVGLGGEFVSEVDLSKDPYAYGSGPYSHSAEFLYDFATRRPFYYQLLRAFDLQPDSLTQP